MKTWLRRIRGAIGTGLTWAIGWAPIGAVTGLLTAALLGFPLGRVAGNYAEMFAVLGFVGGAIFSTFLSLAERRRSFTELSLPRFVAWGAFGGFLLGGLAVAAALLGSGFTNLGAIIISASTLLGAGSAGGTLAIARAAPGNALLEAGQKTARMRPVTGGVPANRE